MNTVILPKSIEYSLYDYFAGKDLLDFRIKKIERVVGGSINSAAIIESNKGTYFIKWNDAQRYPKMFEKEALGLTILENAHEISIPKPILYNETGGYGFLMMEAIRSGEKQNGFWYKFGVQLAELHQHSNDFFGLDHNNYIGSLAQTNQPLKYWAEFFITQRLEPQFKMLMDNKMAESSLNRKFSILFSKIETIFPEEKPALLHGDLWNGNYLVGNSGEAVIFDPAVYFGHREMDLAMSQLFGGFDQNFYAGYHQTKPLENGWAERAKLCNLYPILVHANLFGAGYLVQAEAIIKHFI